MNQAGETKTRTTGDLSLPLDDPGNPSPDWTALDRELHCPRCDYNLHMLTSPRCPECGLEFVWSDLLSASARGRDCPIFEYCWRKRPIRSFFYTIWLTIRPWRCWRAIRMEYEPQVVILLVQCIGFVVAYWVAMVSINVMSALHLSRIPISAQSPLQVIKGQLQLNLMPQNLLSALEVTCIPPVLVLASIGVYRITFSRWRIRWQHQLRVATYSWMTWRGSYVVIAVVGAIDFHLASFRAGGPDRWISPGTYEVLSYIPIFAYLVAVALGFRRYLKLRGGWIAAIASLLLTTTALATISVAFAVYGRRRSFGDSLAHLDDWIPGLQWFCLRVLSAQ